MRVEWIHDPSEFVARAIEFLEARPITRSFVHGMAMGAAERGDVWEGDRGVGLVLGEDDRIVTVITHTMACAASVSDLADARLDPGDAIARHTLAATVFEIARARPSRGLGPDRRWTLFGPAETVDPMAELPVDAGGSRISVRMRLLGHAQRSVSALAIASEAERYDGSAGRYGPVGEEDLDTIVAWRDAFAAETGATGGGTADEMRQRLRSGVVKGWWDPSGTLCSVAQRARPTPASETIGFVYTPPEHRRRGHAARVVAALSAEIRDGNRLPILFTDASNPASNALYRGLGYVPTGEWTELEVHEPES